MIKERGKNDAIKELETSWSVMRSLLSIQTEADYDRAVSWLNDLLDEVGTNEAHPLYDLLDTLGTLIYAYEEEHMKIPSASGIDALLYLMDEHGLTQSDLPEVGSQGVVSEILKGKRQLNVRQINALAKRFGGSAAMFI